MPLTDIVCKNAHKHPKTSTGKPFKLPDEKGLYLLITPQADGWAKWWRFKYRFGGKEKSLSLGTYPDVSLKQARKDRDTARKQIADGTDPSATRTKLKTDQRLMAENAKRVKSGLPILNSFEHVARECLAANVHTVRDITHKKKIRRFEKHVFPVIGGMGIREIKPPDIYSLVKPLFNRLETAHRVHAGISSVFSYAIARPH